MTATIKVNGIKIEVQDGCEISVEGNRITVSRWYFAPYQITPTVQPNYTIPTIPTFTVTC